MCACAYDCQYVPMSAFWQCAQVLTGLRYIHLTNQSSNAVIIETQYRLIDEKKDIPCLGALVGITSEKRNGSFTLRQKRMAAYRCQEGSLLCVRECFTLHKCV